MGDVLMCGLVPHPPLLIPDVGGSETRHVQLTDTSMIKLAEEITQFAPDALIIITPHGPAYSDALPVLYADSLSGDFARFGAPQVKLTYEYEKQLALDIIESCKNADILAVSFDASTARRYGLSMQLDHGALVPLYYLHEAGLDTPIVVIGLAMFSPEELYKTGVAIRDAIDASSKDVCVIISGDLSHRLTRDAPAGYDPSGEMFDRELVRLLDAGDVLGVLQLDETLVEAAGECGLRPIRMMLGMFDGLEIISHVYSYEGPFGVGYAVAKFQPGDANESRRFGRLSANLRNQQISSLCNQESSPVRLARFTIREYVTKGRRIKPPSELDDVLKTRAGVFVTLKKDGRLRGCIGTIRPTCSNVAEEIIQNAISAATSDPRFRPVEEHELDQIVYSVDVLHAPEPISSLDELDPKRYGVVVHKGMRTGLLLPNLDGVDTVEEQVAIACEKAGLKANEPDIKLERFEVVRYT